MPANKGYLKGLGLYLVKRGSDNITSSFLLSGEMISLIRFQFLILRKQCDACSGGNIVLLLQEYTSIHWSSSYLCYEPDFS